MELGIKGNMKDYPYEITSIFFDCVSEPIVLF